MLLEVLGIEHGDKTEENPNGVFADTQCSVVYSDPPANKKVYEEYSQSALSIFMFIMGMLCAHGVEIEVEEPSARINKKRIKRGLPEIMPIHKVFIRFEGERRKVSGKAISASGATGSVRTHWRRGHVRRLPDGKITNVRPTLVGKARLGGDIPEKPQYVVRGNMNELG